MFCGLQPYNRANFNNPSIMTLRRSSDNATATFGFSNGALNQAAIAAWGGVSATGTGSISGYTLTFTGGVIGGQVTGANVLPGTFIASGSSPTWTVTRSQTVGSTSLSVANALFVSKVFDQSGNGAHGIQNTNANQPLLLLNVLGSKSLPVLSSLSSLSTQYTWLNIALAANVPATGTILLAANNWQSQSTGFIADVTASRNLMAIATTPSCAINFGTALPGAVVVGSPFALVGVGNSTSSVVNINGAETTGNAGTTAVNTSLHMLSNAGGTAETNIFVTAFGLWAVGASGAQRQSLVAALRAAGGY